MKRFVFKKPWTWVTRYALALLLLVLAVVFSPLAMGYEPGYTCTLYLYEWIDGRTGEVISYWYAWEDCSGDPGGGGGGPGCPTLVTCSMDSIEGSSYAEHIAFLKGVVSSYPPGSEGLVEVTVDGPGTTTTPGGPGAFQIPLPLESVPEGGALYRVTANSLCGDLSRESSGYISRDEYFAAGGPDSGNYGYVPDEGVYVAVRVEVQGNERYTRYGASPPPQTTPLPSMRTLVSKSYVTSENVEFGQMYSATVSHEFRGSASSSSIMSEDNGPSLSANTLSFVLYDQVWYPNSNASGNGWLQWVIFSSPDGRSVPVPGLANYDVPLY